MSLKKSNQEITTPNLPSAEIISNLVLGGDLSKMDNTQRVQYYNHLCNSLGLNPLTQPFQILKLNGKEVLYAKKDCTEQLRKIYGVSITELSPKIEMGLCWVTAKVQDVKGRTDAATGAVNIDGLKGEALANALMKAETKAKRRATLSICGLGMLDESELDTMPKGETYPVNAPITEYKNEPVQYAEVVPEAPITPINSITQKQTGEIVRLLNNVVITRQEKSKMLLGINTMTEEYAKKAIENLRKTIEDREAEANADLQKTPEMQACKAAAIELYELATQNSVAIGEKRLKEIYALCNTAPLETLTANKEELVTWLAEQDAAAA